jgi:hypothetical protein
MAHGYRKKNQGYWQQQGGYWQQGGYQQQTPPPSLPTPEEFINERLDVYQVFMDTIKARGLDPADYAFFLGPWVTSFILENNRGKKN